MPLCSQASAATSYDRRVNAADLGTQRVSLVRFVEIALAFGADPVDLLADIWERFVGPDPRSDGPSTWRQRPASDPTRSGRYADERRSGSAPFRMARRDRYGPAWVRWSRSRRCAA